MRRYSVALATGLVATIAQGAVAAPGGQHRTVLATKAMYAGGSVAGAAVCSPLCTLTFQVRPGEKYLHLQASSANGSAVAMDVRTATGYVHVCQWTKAGALSIDGLDTVTVIPALTDSTCGGSTVAASGTVIAYFAERNLTIKEAFAEAQPDPDREVTGGI